MIVIIGASASGKTEIAKVLNKKFNFHKCITTTTRAMRVGEKNGVDYHFVSELEFTSLINNDDLVEHAVYNNNYYGLNKNDIKDHGLVIMEPQGANEVIKLLKSEVFVVYVNTNREIRKKRMLNRGDLLTDINKRLMHDDEIFKKENIRRVDLVITNNEQTIEELAAIIAQAYERR